MIEQSKLKTLFIGSGVFAVEILQGLLGSSDVKLVGIITQPNKPSGRKKILTPCPVAEYVTKAPVDKTIKIFQPEKLQSDADIILDKTKPELVIVTDYGQIIPDSIINFPKFKCLNIHGSLLPDLRGAVPIPIAILKGYTETGISIPIMTSKMDDGDVVAFQKEKIRPDDTTESLKTRLAVIGSKLLLKTIPDWVNGNIKPIPQDEAKATYTWQKDIAKEKAQITPDVSALVADRMIRAFFPWPVAWTYISNNKFEKRILKIYKAKFVNKNQIPPGMLLVAEFTLWGEGMLLPLKDGGLELLEVQLEGKTKINAKNAQFLLHENILKTPIELV